jgi:3-hydroxyisobutyrate dehydrogenase-like beta-hydroxyacid dehydrogenase
MKEAVGIIGLGRMGMATAKKLLSSGCSVIGYDRQPEMMQQLKVTGFESAQSYQEVALKAKIIILFVLNDDQVIEIISSKKGVLKVTSSDSIVICMSTIYRKTLEWVANECKKQNVGFIDCPCTGGPHRIENGTLVLIAAASQIVLEKSREVLELLGEIVYVGETPGIGQSIKHCNQLMVGINLAAIMETLILAKRAGLDPQVVCKVIGNGIVGSDLFRIISSSVLDHRPSGGALDQMCKDMDIVINSSRRLKLPLLVGTSAYQYFLLAESLGLENQDNSFLIKAVEKISNSE